MNLFLSAAFFLMAVPPVLSVLIMVFPERARHLVVSLRYRILSEPDADGWQAKANFERKEP